MKNSVRGFAILFFFVPALAIASWRQQPVRQSPAAASAWPEFASSMRKMHAAMSTVQPSGDNDTDFVQLMLAHHQAAIEMAKTQLLRGKDPQLARLAQEIVTDQQSEIDLMHLWLKQHPLNSADANPSLNNESGRKGR